MTDQEYNESVSKLITVLKARGTISRHLASVKEAMGQWDELLADWEDDKQTYDSLFSALSDNAASLSAKNQTQIRELKRTLYPLLLCDLAKCYHKKGRFQDAETALLEAKSLGSQGAEFLLFYIYGKWKGNPQISALVANAFERVKNLDLFSQTVTEEINNEAYQCSVASILSLFYRALDNNTEKAYQILSRALEADWPDNMKQHIRQLLSHYKKTLFGGYKYVE